MKNDLLVFDIGVLQRPPGKQAGNPQRSDRYELETNQVLSEPEHDFHEFYPLLKITVRTKFYTNLRCPCNRHDDRELLLKRPLSISSLQLLLQARCVFMSVLLKQYTSVWEEV